MPGALHADVLRREVCLLQVTVLEHHQAGALYRRPAISGVQLRVVVGVKEEDVRDVLLPDLPQQLPIPARVRLSCWESPC